MQNGIRRFWILVIHEVASDFRKPFFLSAALLQLLTIGMLCYLGNPNLQIKTWNSLFWISLIFSTFQAISRSFTGISRSRWIYLNQLASPFIIVISKITYNGLLMAVFSLLNLLVFSVLLGYPVQHGIVYMASLFLTGLGISTIFTMISAIAGKTHQPGVVAPVLSLPVILPMILVGMQASQKALQPLLVSSVYKDLLLLTALNFLVLVLSGILFTPLWRD
ncbi:MAG: ABC transporter permease [Sphingomonadales bacterium]|nr:ABC transporter permease [Sphingomonadales bacterium]